MDAYCCCCSQHPGSSHLSSTLCWLDIKVWGPLDPVSTSEQQKLISILIGISTFGLLGLVCQNGWGSVLHEQETKFQISKENFVWMKMFRCISVYAVSPCVCNSRKPFIKECSHHPSSPSLKDFSMADLWFFSIYILKIMNTTDLRLLFLYLQARIPCNNKQRLLQWQKQQQQINKNLTPLKGEVGCMIYFLWQILFFIWKIIKNHWLHVCTSVGTNMTSMSIRHCPQQLFMRSTPMNTYFEVEESVEAKLVGGGGRAPI